MKWLCRSTGAAWIVLATCSWSSAGQVTLKIHDGLVTLDARDATIREIFAEWARVGQTRVVNAERVPGAPLTLQLQDVPEGKALEIVLRSVAGYVAAPRMVVLPVQASVSMFDRIVVMPATRPAVVPSGATSTTPAPGSAAQQFNRGRAVPPEPPPVIVDDQDEPLPTAQMPIPGQPPGAVQPGMMTPNPQSAPYGATGGMGAGQYNPNQAQPNQPYGNPYPNPYAPAAPGTGGVPSQQVPQPPQPQSASRPGMPTAPAPTAPPPVQPPQPIKSPDQIR